MFTNNKPLKIIPLGGVGEVTKNMYVYEYGNDQLIVDCGIGFPDESAPGVDFSIPDIAYLEKNKKKIHGIIVTHGHMDHYGGLPYILPRLPNIPVYAPTLAATLAKSRMDEFGVKNPVRIFEKPQKFGPFQVTPIHMTHSTPNCKHLLIKTPGGTVYHGADFKFDLNPIDGKAADFASITRAGEGGIDLLLTDCLGIEKQGITPSERTLMGSIEDEIRKTKGKVIFTTMSSSIARMEMAIRAAAKYNRKVALLGFSIEKNTQAATETGFFNVPKNTLVNNKDMRKYPDHRLLVIVAGSQGQEGSALYKLAHDKHRRMKLKPNDHVIFSSSFIPGNEGGAYDLIDTLYKKGITMAYPGPNNNLHVTGHGHRADLMLLLRLTKPQSIIPIGGDIRHQHQYRTEALKMGFSNNQVHILESSDTLILTKGQVKKGPKVESRNIFVDGLGIGDVGTSVLQERQDMSKNGMLAITIPFSKNTKTLVGNVQVITRGFVYPKSSQRLLADITSKTTQIIKKQPDLTKNWVGLREHLEKQIGDFIYHSTQRRPLIIPELIEV